MQPKFTIPLVLLSILAALGFAAQWLRSQNQVYHLTIATGSQDGEYYAFATALAAVVAHHHPEIKISVAETAGAQENINLLAQNQAQMAIVQSDTPSHASARAVAYLFPEVFHLIVRSNSDIRTVRDLRGKRVALMPEGSGSYRLFWSLSQHYGLTPTDLTALPLPPDAAYRALEQGQSDALFRVLALGNTSMATFLKSNNFQLIPIDQIEALRLSFPFLEATQIPIGTYDGGTPIPATSLSVVGVRAILIAHEQVNPEVVKTITSTLFDLRSEIVSRYPRAATMRLPESSENLGLPLHPGARAFYDREQPIFLVEYAEPIGLLFSVGVLCVSGLWQFRLWLEGRQKNRADFYNQELLELIQKMQTSENLPELEEIRQQLFAILRQVVTDLDQDRISPESFQSFTFPWEVAITSLRHREMLIIQPLQPPSQHPSQHPSPPLSHQYIPASDQSDRPETPQ
ncbi:MAG: TAXI family TRAP transporter solute-binding subunit [Elainella sp. Prado103]|nr:TAXI family TRAP transporter solute-binding subunit [Elainella sp. Prado103]